MACFNKILGPNGLKNEDAKIHQGIDFFRANWDIGELQGNKISYAGCDLPIRLY